MSKSVILLCNEETWPDARNWLAAIRDELISGDQQISSWTCGRVRNIQVGDKVILQRTGKPPRGYFGVGRIVAAPADQQMRLNNKKFEDLSEAYLYSSDDSILVICFEVDAIVHYDKPLEVNYLRSLPQFEGCSFQRMGSGTSFNPEYIDAFEAEWERHLTEMCRINQGVRCVEPEPKNPPPQSKVNSPSREIVLQVDLPESGQPSRCREHLQAAVSRIKSWFRLARHK